MSVALEQPNPHLLRPGEMLRLPVLSTELPICTHPYTPAMEEAVWTWARRFLRFRSEPEGLQYIHGTMSWGSVIAPTWTTTAAELSIEWTCALFVHDDLSARPALAEAFANCGSLRDLPAEAGWLGEAMRDLWDRTAPLTTQRVLARLSATLSEFFQGCWKELPLRDGVGALGWTGWEDYLRMRREIIGMPIFMILAQIGLELDLDDESFEATFEIADIVNDHVTLTNDIFSLRKEIFDGDCVNGIVSYALAEDVSIQDAIDTAASMACVLERRFLSRRHEILLDRPHLDGYLRALGHIISGNQHWNYTTPRYHGRGYIWNGVKSGVMELHQDRTVIRPADGPLGVVRTPWGDEH